MEDILFSRTFAIIAGMLVITAFGARANKSFETKREMWFTIILSFVALFGIMIFQDSFPLNLVLVGVFSGLVGWEIGPTIEFYKISAKRKERKRQNNIVLQKKESLSPEQEEKFQEYLVLHPISEGGNTVVAQAFFGTALAVLATAGTVFFTSYDFSFMGTFLLVALILLIVMSVLNMIFFKSKTISLIKSYFGVLIFTGFLLYDFSILKNNAGDDSRGTAVNIAVNIYLDIINLFLELLAILASD